MFDNVTIAFIGSGNMAEAMIQGALRRDLVAPRQVVASDIRAERGEELVARYGIRATTDNLAAAQGASIVVLAVKPQVLPAVLDQLEGQIPPEAVVLSIVTGARIAALVEGLRHEAIVRAMPNTPALVGEGMVVWTATAATTEGQRGQVEALFQATGEAIYVQEEKYLDAATAVSGSGPAYVYLFMEAMVDAAVYLGFARPIARQLVLQTVTGAARFAAESGRHLADLRNMVTTPGGTTAEALLAMEQGRLRATVTEGIRAAYEKSQRLADHS
ncbi:MAG: pyrroline-5-carboxylate reductase [Anaerolineae bacterium]|nr:pyrroline-5-carboxylate reductase [Anaerolineae bacterium]